MISLIKQYPGLKDTQREVSELLDSRYSQSAAITIDEKIQLPQTGQHPDSLFCSSPIFHNFRSTRWLA